MTADIAEEGRGDEKYVRVGFGVFLEVPLYGRDPFDVLDEHSGDAMEIGEQIFDGSGDLREDFTEKIECLGDRILVMDTIWLERRWRGQGLGVIVAGMAIDALVGGALAVVCTPAPIDSPPGSEQSLRELTENERALAVDKIANGWRRLGFEHHSGGVYYLDPARSEFSRKYRGLMTEFLQKESLRPGSVDGDWV